MQGDDVEQAALAALFVPFESGALTWAHRTAFLRARIGPPLQSHPNLVCEQTFKPDADALVRAGFEVHSQLAAHGAFDRVLVLPPRQKEEARALMARAVGLCKVGGQVVMAVSNNSGARSSQADLQRLAGEGGGLSKHKCRVFWTAPLAASAVDASLLASWLQADAPRPILDGRFVSRPGVFAWDRIDPASALLAESLPTDLSGRAADPGAGYGFLSAELLKRCPRIESLDVYEAEARALDLCRTNLSAARVAIDYRWHDVVAGLNDSYDTIVMNPPFHTSSGAENPGLGRRFIVSAAAALRDGGRLWLVANRHLPYESVLNASFGTVRTVVEKFGFKIIEAVRESRRAKR